MHRRDFLKTVALGATAAGAGSCAHLSTTLLTTGTDVLQQVKALKTQLSFLGSPEGEATIRADAPAAATQAPGFEHDLKLFGDGMRALTLAGAFHCMNEETRMHPAVQQLMLEATPQLGETVTRLHRVALDTTPEQRRALTAKLKADPSLLDQAGARMDAVADELGVSFEQRTRLRALFVQVGNRMTQSTALTLDEYGRKVKALEDRLAEPRGLEREAIGRLGEEAYWAYHQQLQQYASAWGGLPPLVEASGPEAPSEPPEVLESPLPVAGRPHRLTRGQAALRDGAIMLSVGLGIGVLAGLVYIISGPSLDGRIAGMLVATPGALLILAGLITLLVGAAFRGSETAK